MVHPTGYMRKEGVVAAQDQHLGRTYVSSLFPVPVHDSARGGVVSVSAGLTQQGVLWDVGSVDPVRGTVSILAITLYEPVELLQDAIRGGVIGLGATLRTPQQDASLSADGIQQVGAILTSASLRTAHIQTSLDDHTTGGIVSVGVTLLTN